MRKWIGWLSLIVGATAFLYFWGTAPTFINDITPWPVSLAVHGVSLVLLSTGLIWVALQVSEPVVGSWVTRAGAGVGIAGLLTVFPLIPLGFGIFSVGLVLAGRDRIGPTVATAGSAVLLAAVVLGARVGMEDAPELSDGLRVAFQAGVLLIAAGLVIVGLGERQRIRRPSRPQEASVESVELAEADRR